MPTVHKLAVTNRARLAFEMSGAAVWCADLHDHAAAGPAILLNFLARCLKVDPSTLRLSRDRWGKLHLIDHPNVQVNLSRSGSQLAVAIARSAVGVDIEVLRSVPEREGMLALHLTPSERRDVWRADDHQRNELFLLAWTRKEAIAKAIGYGLRIAPALIDAGASPRRRHVTTEYGNVRYVVEVESRRTARQAVVSAAMLVAVEDVGSDFRDSRR